MRAELEEDQLYLDHVLPLKGNFGTADMSVDSGLLQITSSRVWSEVLYKRITRH